MANTTKIILLKQMKIPTDDSQILDDCEIKVAQSGERLDVFLAVTFPDISRSRIQKLIASGNVTVNGSHAKVSSRLVAGQELRMVIPSPAPSRVEAEAIPITVVYEDSDMLVVDKPAGMLVHPAPGQINGTLVSAVLSHCPSLSGVGDVRRPGIVHRLDKDTSGLIAVAKNDLAHIHLSKQFKDRTVLKVYLALVHGVVLPAEAVIDAPIGRHPGDRKRMSITTSGKSATTQYRVKQQLRDKALLEVKPITGRTHQIRVHLASVGYSVVGDGVYGKKHTGLDRHFLHASVLRLRVPSTGEFTEFKSNLPQDLNDLLHT